MRTSTPWFSYDEAFSRNLGWMTAWEQDALRRKRVAIAGMGGVGGLHLLTLARLGIGAFNIADFDRFELANFNRQMGAFRATVGRPKAEVLAEMAREVNPELDLQVFDRGVTPENIDAFLDRVDLFVDGLDFFTLDIRARVFARCAERGIPAITAAPIGMGTAFLVFMPGKMTFEEYFRLQNRTAEDQRVNFLIGLTPRTLQRPYLMDFWRLDLAGQRAPSTSAACQLCAGVAGTEAVKILLQRGRVRAAPYYHQFDAYRGKWAVGWMPGGNENPLQRLRRALARRTLRRLGQSPPPAELPAIATAVERILDLARWAPSGDNAQPWRFAVRGDAGVTITINRHDADDVYDYADGRPTRLSAGFLLETLRIAASGAGRGLSWRHRRDDTGAIVIEADLPPDAALVPDPLLPMVTARSVDRRPYRLTPLRPEQKAGLAAALGDGLTVRWFETSEERRRIAGLNARATDIRLRIPEAYRVHQAILDWQRDFSPTGVPVAAVGLNPLAVQTMRWLMRDWTYMDAANRYLGTTLLSRLELDLLPGYFCGAHFVVLPNRPADLDDPAATMRIGQALQRFWLAATGMGLVMQPALATICFALYGRQGTVFTKDTGILRKAGRLADAVAAVVPGGASEIAFIGRIGVPRSRRIQARSVRRPLSELLDDADAGEAPYAARTGS
jgi:molybdopterin/thiamine biosynthesis adenylyltransferase/nitroreductase